MEEKRIYYVGIDHGNHLMKTSNHVFENGVERQAVQGISKVRGIALDTLEEKGFQVTFHENMQAAMTADEIVTEDLFATIDCNKRVRLEHAKENIAFEHAETQRMEA